MEPNGSFVLRICCVSDFLNSLTLVFSSQKRKRREGVVCVCDRERERGWGVGGKRVGGGEEGGREGLADLARCKWVLFLWYGVFFLSRLM